MSQVLRKGTEARAALDRSLAILDGDLAAFIDFLRTDERFYARTPDELLAAAARWRRPSGLLRRWKRRCSPSSPFRNSSVP